MNETCEGYVPDFNCPGMGGVTHEPTPLPSFSPLSDGLAATGSGSDPTLVILIGLGIAAIGITVLVWARRRNRHVR